MCKIFDRSKSPIALLTFLIQGVRMEPFTITMGMIANDFVTFRGAVCRNLMALGWQMFHSIALLHDDKANCPVDNLGISSWQWTPSTDKVLHEAR